MNIDLSDLKQGETVFSIHDGHVEVTTIVTNIIHPNGSESYYNNGKCDKEDMHPSLFHSIEECIEYFQSVKKKLDEESKPKKRYWIWSTNRHNQVWIKDLVYMDETGRDSKGTKCYDDWFEKEKIKHENEFIDI